jgi:hypothetical protein
LKEFIQFGVENTVCDELPPLRDGGSSYCGHIFEIPKQKRKLMPLPRCNWDHWQDYEEVGGLVLVVVRTCL